MFFDLICPTMVAETDKVLIKKQSNTVYLNIEIEWQKPSRVTAGLIILSFNVLRLFQTVLG